VFKCFWGNSACDINFLSFQVYNKKITLDQIRKAVDLAHEMDFISCGNFILGVPIETEKHIRQTIKFACSLPLDIAMFNPLIYFYGSDLWFEAKKDGKIDDDIGYSINAGCESNLSNFTSEKLKAFSRKATQKFYFRPYYIIGEIMKAFRNNDFRLIRTELNYL
jgi:radical SAM superfamily enzyme YgiQ (UPF0313 family)